MDKDKINELKEAFLSFDCNANFRTFGTCQEYLDEEDKYKRECIERMHHEFDEWVKGKADSLSPQQIVDKLIFLLRKPLKESKTIQNLVHWSDVNRFIDIVLHKPKAKKDWRQIFHTLLKKARYSIKIDAELDRLIKFIIKYNGTAADTKLFPTFFLFLWKPKKFIYIKPRNFDSFLKYIDQPHLGQGKILSVDEYKRILGIAADLKKAIADFEPRDMVDIYTFIHHIAYCLKNESPKAYRNRKGKVKSKKGKRSITKIKGPPEFKPEFIGKRIRYTERVIKTEVLHGTIVNTLRMELDAMGIKGYNSKERDLFVLDRKDNMKILFEIKTNVETTSIYQGIGQLMYHGARRPYPPRRILVIPNAPKSDTKKILASLQIETLLYTIKKDNCIFKELNNIIDNK